MSDWTPERLEDLSRWWNQGESAGAIARRLGFTRSAVIGKVFRLRKAGHDLRDRPPAVRLAHLFMRSRALPSPPVRPMAEPVRAVASQAVPPVMPLVEAVVHGGVPVGLRQKLAAEGRAFLAQVEAAMPGGGVPIAEVGARMCVNVTGGEAPQWLFCGQEALPGGRYCAACRPKMFLPVKAAPVVAPQPAQPVRRAEVSLIFQNYNHEEPASWPHHDVRKKSTV